MSRRHLTLVMAAAATVLLGVLTLVLPTPYIVLLPGPTFDTLGQFGDGGPQIIQVAGTTTYPTTGHLYLTTVDEEPPCGSTRPTLWTVVRSWASPTDAVVPRDVLCPKDQSAQQVQQQNVQEMTQSQSDAVIAALYQLKVPSTDAHITVSDTEPGTDAGRLLQPGDAFLSINGTAVSDDLTAFKSLVASHPVGTALTVVVRRNNKPVTVTLHTIDGGSGMSILGITPDRTANFGKVSVSIGVNPDAIGGPSAGLMFALGVIDRLTPGGITGGRSIAGTGAITGFGDVGPIGGIQQKIAGAERDHISVFMAPSSECSDARSVAESSLIIVKVDTLAGAVAALKAINSGSTDYPHC